MADGKLREAENCYREAITLNPGNADAFVSLGSILSQQGLIKDAETCFNKAILLSPTNALAQYYLGGVLLKKGNYEAAILSFNNAIKLMPEAEIIYRDLCFTFFQAGQYDAAKQVIQKGLLLDKNVSDYHLLLGKILQNENNSVDAINCYRMALLIQPDSKQVLHSLACCLFAQGDQDEAISHFGTIYDINPNDAKSYYDLGVMLNNQQLLGAAETCYRNAILHNPHFIDAHYQLGNILKKQGREPEAIACYRSALFHKPDFVDALFNLGVTLNKLGQKEEAKVQLQKAVNIKPDFAVAHANLGLIYMADGIPDKALVCFQHAQSYSPDFPDIHYYLGSSYLSLQKWDEAFTNYKTALKLNPADAYSCLYAGNILKMQGNSEEAMFYFLAASKLKPDLAEAYSNIGVLFQEQGSYNNALHHYIKALDLQPDLVDTRCNMGLTFVDQGKYNEAIACFRRALEIQPDFYPARINLIRQLQNLCLWQDLEVHITFLRKIIIESSDAIDTRITSPFTFLALPGVTSAEQKYCAEKLVNLEFKPLAALHEKLAFKYTPNPNQKVTVGYLSADFKQHPVSFLMAEVYELHDRNKFSVIAYSYGADDGSNLRKRLERSFDKFVDIQNSSHEEAARIINADHVDILIDLTGYTASSRSAIMALRPAPIQVNYLGYPGTMGGDFVDYLIADKFIIPAEQQQNYSEKIVWLPDCYMPCDRTRARLAAPRRLDLGLPENSLVFCCFNQVYKITPDIFDIWCRLMRAVQHSVLWLPASNTQAENNLKSEAKKRGIEPDRIIMAPKLKDIDNHLARLQCADIFLDTTPFNAHTTSSDALWMGLPIVTCVGDTFPSRVAGSLLTSIDVPELITYNLSDYYTLALDLATDNKKLMDIHLKIRENRDTKSLFNSQRFTRNLEQAYLQMLSNRSDKFRI